jgi:tetratricopeptide (TPR) repeat protein
MHKSCKAALLALMLGFAPGAFAQQNMSVDPGRVTELEGRMRANYIVRFRACLFYVPVFARLENDNSPRDLVRHAEMAQACWNAENDAMVGVSLTRALERIGDLSGAAAAMDAAQTRFPDNAIIYAGLAGQTARAGDMEGANRALDRAIELGPPRGDRDPDNWTMLTLALLDGDAHLPLRLRLSDEALARADRRRNRGEKVRALTARARVLAEAERHTDAIADLERALSFADDTNRANVLHLRARSQRALGNLDAGRADFAAALAAAPRVAASEASYRREQEADAASAACRTAVRKALDMSTAADDDVDATLAAADECVASGQTAVGLTLRASERSRLGDRSEALALLERALAADPTYAYAHSVRASTLSAMGQHADAITALNRAIELDADNAQFYMARATTHISLNDRAAARVDQERALEFDPSFSNRREYVRNLSALEDHRCALAAIDAIGGDDFLDQTEYFTMRGAEIRHVNRLPREQRACATPVAYGSALEF